MVDSCYGGLMEIEKYFSEAVRASQCLKFQDLQPFRVVEQISRELLRQRFIWLGKETYVPNRMVAHVQTCDPDKLAALKSIFNSPALNVLLTQYIAGCGFKLFDSFEVEVVEFFDGGVEKAVENRCRVEFYWSIAEGGSTNLNMDQRSERERSKHLSEAARVSTA